MSEDIRVYSPVFEPTPNESLACIQALQKHGYPFPSETLVEMVQNSYSQVFKDYLNVTRGLVETFRLQPLNLHFETNVYEATSLSIRTVNTIAKLRACKDFGRDAWKHLVVRVEVGGVGRDKQKFFTDLAEIVSAKLLVSDIDYNGYIPGACTSVIFWLRQETDFDTLVEFLNVEKSPKGNSTIVGPRYSFESKALWREIGPVSANFE